MLASTMKIRPLLDRVIVERLKAEAKTPGGIIVPDAAKEKPVEGMVTAVGPGRRLENGSIQAVDVKVGDRVMFGKYAGTEMRGNENMVILREEEILGVVEP